MYEDAPHSCFIINRAPTDTCFQGPQGVEYQNTQNKPSNNPNIILKLVKKLNLENHGILYTQN